MGSQFIRHGPKVGRGTQTPNVGYYGNPKFQALELGRDLIKFENKELRQRNLLKLE
jgi:hypothetical protein